MSTRGGGARGRGERREAGSGKGRGHASEAPRAGGGDCVGARRAAATVGVRVRAAGLWACARLTGSGEGKWKPPSGCGRGLCVVIESAGLGRVNRRGLGNRAGSRGRSRPGPRTAWGAWRGRGSERLFMTWSSSPASPSAPVAAGQRTHRKEASPGVPHPTLHTRRGTQMWTRKAIRAVLPSQVPSSARVRALEYIKK